MTHFLEFSIESIYWNKVRKPRHGASPIARAAGKFWTPGTLAGGAGILSERLSDNLGGAE